MNTHTAPAEARRALNQLRRQRQHPAPQRQPAQAWRVRWVKPWWSDKNGWSSEWYLQLGAALRCVDRLNAAGAVVQLDHFELDHTATLDMYPDGRTAPAAKPRKASTDD